MHTVDKNLSYTKGKEILNSALCKLGLDHSEFGLHSYRSCGATAAASTGIQDRLYKKKKTLSLESNNTKDGYVKEKLP